MIEKNEYRATHEEKNGIVRELRNLEEKYRQEFEEAIWNGSYCIYCGVVSAQTRRPHYQSCQPYPPIPY